jgi:1,4-dihydroxy-2-naphthoate octaprenyltransferase
VLVFTPRIKAGEHTLSVEFTNDYYDKKTGADRNILLGDLEILYNK